MVLLNQLVFLLLFFLILKEKENEKKDIDINDNFVRHCLDGICVGTTTPGESEYWILRHKSRYAYGYDM
jgi:hypothetical protein